MERKRVLVSFGDILGFTPWIKRPSSAPEDVASLMTAIYDEFESFAVSSGGVVKYIGDSVMVILEMKAGHSCSVTLNFMRKSFSFAERVEAIIKTCWPRPTGFRLRMAAGYVYKHNIMTSLDGKVGHSAEYIGYPVNLAQRLLYVQPSTLCICHESVKQILGKKKHGLRLDPIKLPTENPRGIDSEDLTGLWSFRLESSREKPDRRSARKT